MSYHLLLSSCLVLLPIISHADRFSCASVDAELELATTVDADLICRSIERTADLMGEMGFNTDTPIRIEVSDQIPLVYDTASYGFYDCQQNRIELLELEALKTPLHRIKPFGLEVSDQLYASLVAHEVSHAYIDANAPDKGLSLSAHEYIAYVVQLSVLPDKMRTEIIDRIDLPAFGHESEITDLYLQLNPEGFAVKSWLHYRQPDNGNRFIDKILARGALRQQSVFH